MCAPHLDRDTYNMHDNGTWTCSNPEIIDHARPEYGEFTSSELMEESDCDIEEDNSITIGGDCDGRMEAVKFDATKYIRSDEVTESSAVDDSFLLRAFFVQEILVVGVDII